MIKTVKKSFCILITVCMLFAIMPSAMAEDSYSLQGETNIFAPPEGKFAEIPYTIVNDATKEAVPTTITISGAPEGVAVNDSGTALLIVGSIIKSGSFTVTATATGGETAPITKTVTVEEYRIYEDFESQTAGDTALVYATGLSDPADKQNIQNGSTITISESADGNNYVNATGTYGTYYLEIKPENNGEACANWENTRYVTFEFDANGRYAYSYQPIFLENASKNFGVGVQWNYIITKNKAVGNQDYDGLVWTTYPDGWAKMQMTVDYYTREYTLNIQGTKYGPFPMQNDEGTYPKQLLFGRPVDNISVYSGKPVNVSASGISVENVAENLYVGSKAIKYPLPEKGAITVGSSDVPTTINWSFSSGETTDETTDAKIENNKYLVIPAGTTGDITLTAEGGGSTQPYTINLLSAIEFENDSFTDEISKDYFVGITKIEATYSGTDVELEGLNKNYDLPDEGTLEVYINTVKKEYSVFCNGEIVGEDLYITYETLDDIKLSNAIITDLYVGGVFEEKPKVFNVNLVPQTPAIGQSMSVSYEYFSMLCDENEDEVSVTWYVKDADTVLDTKTSKTYFINGEGMIGKKLSASVKVTDENGTKSDDVNTAGSEIKDIFDVSINTDGKLVVDVLSVDDSLLSFIIGVEYFGENKERIGTLTKYASDGNDEYVISNVTGFDNARVWLMNNDLTPIAGDKLAKSGDRIDYDTSEEMNGLIYEDEDGCLDVYNSNNPQELATVIVYKPASDADFVNSCSGVDFGYPWDNEISYIGVVNSNANILIHKETDTLRSGLYNAVSIAQSGTRTEKEFIISKEKLFTADKLQDLSEAEFTKVMQLTGGSEDCYEYLDNANISDVKTLMQGEEYDMTKLKTAILLSAFLEDKNNKEALVENLGAEKAKGIELILENKNFANSASHVDLSGGIEGALYSILETAVLQGVANSTYFVETKKYLSSIDGYTVSDEMAMAFTPSSENSHVYATLDALKAALDSYTNTPSTDGSTDTGTDNSNDGLGGTTGNSGFVGGGGGGGGGSSKPSSDNKDDQPNAENQGTNSTSQTFSDVSANHWASSDISYLVENKIISGMGDGSFRPENSITRAEFLKILAVAFPITATEDAAQFEDVNKNDWYYQYVIKASEAGVVSGDGRNFRPNDAISRQDAAVMLYRALTNLNVELDEGESTMADSADISSYALNAVNALYVAGIINGMGDGTFMPKNNITRAQAAAIVARVLR